jgi:uncharacterized repeat protein (TIGR03803 family)
MALQRRVRLAGAADRKWTLTILHSFLYDGTEGAVPQGGLIIDHFGNLYGTASQGGTSDACNSILNFPGCGVVFELARSANGSWAYRVIHNFSFSDGAYPLGALLLDEAGSLYGTTEYGGYESCYGGCGVVFKLAPCTGPRVAGAVSDAQAILVAAWYSSLGANLKKPGRKTCSTASPGDLTAHILRRGSLWMQKAGSMARLQRAAKVIVLRITLGAVVLSSNLGVRMMKLGHIK